MTRRHRCSQVLRPLGLSAAVFLASSTGCTSAGSSADVDTDAQRTTAPQATTAVPSTAETPSTTTDSTPDDGAEVQGNEADAPPLTRPSWLGQRPLTTDENGFGIPQPTPAELADRKLPTIDTLPPPPQGPAQFVSTVSPLDGEPLARSTWKEGCPVPPERLRYVTVSFWGFDGQVHTGELVLAEEWTDAVVGVFEVAWNEQFPFEEMRIVTPADLEAAPTGDTNNTASFVCRAVTGGSRFSEHAFGLAVDINPFHNPYLRDDLVLPELAAAYLEREDAREGMLFADSPVVVAFAEIGWSWGGEWTSLKDWQHFSHNGL